MSEPQKKETIAQLQTKLRLLGFFLTPTQHRHVPHPQSHLHSSLQSMTSKRKTPFQFTPLSVQIDGSSLAILDYQGKAWLVADFLHEPLCISDLLRMKVQKLALSSNQLVIHTVKECLLVVWGPKRPLPLDKLIELPLSTKHKYAHYFQFYRIEESTGGDIFSFSACRRPANEITLYNILGKQNTIIGFPRGIRLNFSRKIIGISAGKTHCLCWDEAGMLFSWGERSIALGYESLPEQDYIQNPRAVYGLPGRVVSAFAGCNYSLAAALEGGIYEWGVRKNNSKEELIFEPKELKIHRKKWITLKGRDGKLAALSLAGQLFLWGKQVKQFFPLHKQPLQTNGEILEPVQLPNCKFIIDFDLSESCLAIIESNEGQNITTSTQATYWNTLKQNIKHNLQAQYVKTQGQNQSQRRSKLSVRNLSLIRGRDPIQLAFSKRKHKQQYLQAASDSDSLINYIMQPTERYQHDVEQLNHLSVSNQADLSIRKKGNQRCNTTFSEFTCEVMKQKENVKNLVHSVNQLQLKPKMMRVSRTFPQTFESRPGRPYISRLQQVLKNRQMHEEQMRAQTLRRVEKGSYQFRLQRLKQQEQNRKQKREGEIWRHSVGRLLMKQYLVKMLTCALGQGRQAKIASFARSLRLERLQKNIRGVFVRTRVKMQMRQLRKNQMFRFFLLAMVFQQYVKRFRIRKAQTLKKLIVRQTIKSVLKDKMRAGVGTCLFSARKLHKLREWLAMVRCQRRKCLKFIWKSQVLSLMRLNAEQDSHPRNLQQLTFQSLYQQKVVANPSLHLSHFLEKQSIFRIKAKYFQKLATLFRAQARGTGVKTSRTKKGGRIKFRGDRVRGEQQQQKGDRLTLLGADVLPYSLHYNLVTHPKQFDLAIPQMMKLSDRWVKQQRKSFERQLDHIIKQHELLSLKRRRQYDLQLALFIARNYDQLAQKRWKFIVQFNQIERTPQKIKREKQLRRLLGLIGAQRLMDEDCIPEKHAVMEEALRRVDSPSVPSPYIVFGQSEFKQMFRIYYEELSTRAKDIRRVFF